MIWHRLEMVDIDKFIIPIMKSHLSIPYAIAIHLKAVDFMNLDHLFHSYRSRAARTTTQLSAH